jgi:hypothetical protein
VRQAPASPNASKQVALERLRIGAVASRVFEWLRSEAGEQAVGRICTELGYRLNDPERPGARRCIEGTFAPGASAIPADATLLRRLWQSYPLRTRRIATSLRVGLDGSRWRSPE